MKWHQYAKYRAKVRPNNSQSDAAAIFPSLTPKAVKRVLEFFTAQISNDHTRRAYMNAARRFADWSAGQRYSGAFPGSAFPRGRLYQGSAGRAFVAHSQAAPGRTPGCCSTGDCGRGGDLPQSARHGEDQVAASDLMWPWAARSAESGAMRSRKVLARASRLSSGSRVPRGLPEGLQASGIAALAVIKKERPSLKKARSRGYGGVWRAFALLAGG
jgi:hypothetical protein